MDNNWNVSAAAIDTFIEEAYEGYITTLSYISALALVFYAALSKLPEEVEHIWFKPFSLPTLLYIFARYAVLTWAGLCFFILFLPLEKSCNTYSAVDSMLILSNIGVQGLLSARAYSLCKGEKILTMSLVSCFLAQLIALFYDFIRFPGCSTSISVGEKLILLGQNIVGIIADVIIFGICIWKVWGTWKLNLRQAGIQSGRSLVYIVLKQSIIRCCFVITFSITHTILLAIYDVHVTFSDSDLFIPQDFNVFSNVLSGILVADFTLDLRRLNSAKITASNISLPTLQFSNVLQHAHQSILVEMATPEEEEEGGDHGHDDIPESANVMDIQPVQE